MGMRKKKGPGVRLKLGDSCNGSGLRRPDENDVSNTDVLLKLRTRALKYGNIKNRRTAHDFLDWITLQWLEGKSQHQTIEQSYKDFLRKFHGVERAEAHQKRQQKDSHTGVRTKVRSLNERFIGGWVEEGLNLKRNPKREVTDLTILSMIPDKRHDEIRDYNQKCQDLERVLTIIHKHFTERELLIMRLAIQWNFSMLEISRLFGVNEARIHQIFHEIIPRIQKLKVKYKIK